MHEAAGSHDIYSCYVIAFMKQQAVMTVSCYVIACMKQQAVMTYSCYVIAFMKQQAVMTYSCYVIACMKQQAVMTVSCYVSIHKAVSCLQVSSWMSWGSGGMTLKHRSLSTRLTRVWAPQVVSLPRQCSTERMMNLHRATSTI